VRQLDLLGWRRRRWLPGGCLWVDFPENITHNFIIGLLIDIMDVDVADNAGFVDDEDRSL
jgi:hypothetical protein